MITHADLTPEQQVQNQQALEVIVATVTDEVAEATDVLVELVLKELGLVSTPERYDLIGQVWMHGYICGFQGGITKLTDNAKLKPERKKRTKKEK